MNFWQQIRANEHLKFLALQKIRGTSQENIAATSIYSPLKKNRFLAIICPCILLRSCFS